MGKKLVYERYHWFYGQIKEKQYPNARKLSETFEISAKQAQRDIEFIRERLGAPLYYNPDKKGYEFEDDGYELPPIWFKEDELLALCLSLRLASTLPDRSLKKSLYELLEKFLTFRFLESPPNLLEIREKVSVKNIEYYRVDEAIFHKIMGPLFQGKPIAISYYSPHKHEQSERIIFPLHLLCYMGRWHLIAFCTLRNELRNFALSRVRSVDVFPGTVNLPQNLPRVRDYIRKNFGLITGQNSVEVCLKFSPDVAEVVSEQIWFKSQEVIQNEDGSICLKFPVADFREVKKEILRYGAEVEVLSPPELRNEVKREMERMTGVYK